VNENTMREGPAVAIVGIVDRGIVRWDCPSGTSSKCSRRRSSNKAKGYRKSKGRHKMRGIANSVGGEYQESEHGSLEDRR
jgi:hypothetical protein